MSTEADSTSGTIRSLYEVTTSGMTHSWGSKHGYCGRLNKSKLCTFYPFQKLVESVMMYAHFASPWTATLQSEKSSESQTPPKNIRRLQYTLDRNVAEFEFDWIDRTVTIRVLGESGQTLLREDWSMNRLTTSEANDTMLDENAFGVGKDRLESSLKNPLPANQSEFVCVNYRGNPNHVHFALGIGSTIGLFVIAGIAPFLFCLYLLVAVARRFCRRDVEE